MSQEGEVCTLKMPKFTKADAGTYKCIVTNPAGTTSCEASVTLFGM